MTVSLRFAILFFLARFLRRRTPTPTPQSGVGPKPPGWGVPFNKAAANAKWLYRKDMSPGTIVEDARHRTYVVVDGGKNSRGKNGGLRRADRGGK